MIRRARTVLPIFLFVAVFLQNFAFAQEKSNDWNRLKHSAMIEARRFKGHDSFIIQDLETGWSFGYQERKIFPAASLIKVPMMAACFQAVQDGKIQLDQEVVLHSWDKTSGSGKLKAMPSGVSFTVRQLMGKMIMESDNTATNLLIDLIGFENLNHDFKRRGLQSTTISRKMMDFSQRAQGVENYTTAEEISLVLLEIYSRQLISPEVSDQCLELLKKQKHHDRIPAQLPKGTIVAHKTGLEQGVCHDAGIVFTRKGNFLITVLTKNGKRSPPAKRFIAKLSLLTYQYMTS